MNIQAQLDELRHLENGWFDGDGLAPSLEGLDWLTTQFTADHYDALPRPYIFPTPQGCVRAEWSVGHNSAILEINLEDRSGYWYSRNRLTDIDEERTLNLCESDEWAWLNARLRRFSENGVSLDH